MGTDLDVLQLNLFPGELVARKVSSNSHIAFQGVYYSVPHALLKTMVIVRATKYTIDILDSSGLCVAVHRRCYTKRTYVTDPSHMPPFYYSLLGTTCFDGALFRDWAKHIGDSTYQLIDTLLSNKQIEQHAYKSSMAILQLSKKYGSKNLNSACALALLHGKASYYSVRKILAGK